MFVARKCGSSCQLARMYHACVYGQFVEGNVAVKVTGGGVGGVSSIREAGRFPSRLKGKTFYKKEQPSEYLPQWFEDRGLPSNHNTFGPLSNLPDYTFLDGRMTPIGSNQRKRLLRQREIAAKIVEYSAELDFAKKRAARIKADEATKRQEIIANKLKPKGHLLLKKE